VGSGLEACCAWGLRGGFRSRVQSLDRRNCSNPSPCPPPPLLPADCPEGTSTMLAPLSLHPSSFLSDLHGGLRVQGVSPPFARPGGFRAWELPGLGLIGRREYWARGVLGLGLSAGSLLGLGLRGQGAEFKAWITAAAHRHPRTPLSPPLLFCLTCRVQGLGVTGLRAYWA